METTPRFAVGVRLWAGEPVVVKTGWGEAAGVALRREASVLDLVRHPGIVELVSIDQRGTALASMTRLVTRLAGTHTLTSAPPCPPTTALTRAGQMLATLAAVHGRGLAHGSVGPAHVVISPTGSIRWCGLGHAHPASTSTRLAEVGIAADLATEQLVTARRTASRRGRTARVLAEGIAVLGDDRLDAAAMASALTGLLASLGGRRREREPEPGTPLRSPEADGNLVGEQPTSDGQHDLLPPSLNQFVEDSGHLGGGQC